MAENLFTILPPVQETMKTKSEILTHIEEMFLARESTLKDLLETQKVKQDTKYKRFKNRVMPLNEDGAANGNKKVKTKEKKKKCLETEIHVLKEKEAISRSHTFVSLFGFFETWLKTRREWKPKKNKAKYEVCKELGECDDKVPKGEQAFELMPTPSFQFADPPSTKMRWV